MCHVSRMDVGREQREYVALCDEARALGVSTSLDDPRSPRTVAALRDAVRVACPLWRIVLDTGRLGDWVLVEADDEPSAIRKLTRAQRRKVGYVRRVWRSSELRQQNGGGL